MRAQAREHAPRECGGMLLGWETGGQIVVSELVPAGPNAVHARSSFIGDGEWQQGELERIYRASGRRVTFLGDWHSHPRGSRRPSGRDQDTARAVAQADGGRTPEPVTLILCRGTRGWRAHPYRQRDGRLQPLALRVYPDR